MSKLSEFVEKNVWEDDRNIRPSTTTTLHFAPVADGAATRVSVNKSQDVGYNTNLLVQPQSSNVIEIF